MSDTLPNFGLPLLLPAQAQKHVTHNEALAMLDAGAQLVLEELAGATPPASPGAGACHAVGAAATGAWAGQGGRVAVAEAGGGWRFLSPREGWLAWDRAGGGIVVWDGTAWGTAAPATPETLGVNTTADATNRLSVAAPAVLFSHEPGGADHRLNLNRAGTSDTASLVFQSGFSGRAEIGLTGGEGLSVKVSADGAAWTTALEIDGGSGAVSGLSVQQSATDATPGRLMLAEHGLSRGGLLDPVAMNAGQPAGGVIERGADAGGEWVKWADGTVLVTREVTVDINSTALQSFAYPVALTSVTGGGHVGSDSAEAAGTGATQRREALAMLALWIEPAGWTVRMPSAIAADTITCRLSASGLWL